MAGSQNKQPQGPPRGETYRAGLPTLGARLLAVGGLVRQGHVAADIGCDHGKLAVWLAKKGCCPTVIAVDSRPMPLARAQALAHQAGCAHLVQCRLGSGLAPLAPLEADDIIIAGLSGETITDILAACGWLGQAKAHLVLMPTSRPQWLRRWLCQNGYAIRTEVAVLENYRSYSAISATYTGQATTPTAAFCQVGLVPQAQDSAAAAAYIKARLAHLQKQTLAPMDEAQLQAHKALIEEVSQWLP